MVRRDAIAQHGQFPCRHKIDHRARIRRHALEIGGMLDIGRHRVPIIGQRFVGFDRLPFRRSCEDIAISAAKHFRGQGFGHSISHFLLGRPDILQKNRLTVTALTQGLGGDIAIKTAGQSIGHDQRR